MFTNILADEIIVGKNVIIEPTALIRGVAGRATKIVLGDNVYIGHDVQIICNDFSIGDYSKVHHHSNFHGHLPLQIGHNSWIGQYTIIDSLGGVVVGNNCCVGANSHLWSHIRFGDLMEGCRFKNEKPLIIGNDVWFGGHCNISPITACDKSMALSGATVTHDMNFNEIYAGIPAKSISHKVGYQFKYVSDEAKVSAMFSYILDWGGDGTLIRVITNNELSFIKWEDDITYFNVSSRTYTKKNTPTEISFMKFLLPHRAKFVPSPLF